MLHRASLPFACAFILCLAWSALPTCVRAQTQNSDVSARTAKTSQTDGAQKPGSAAPAKPVKGKAEDRTFKDVPADSPLYAALADLQQQGVLLNYPEGYFRGRRPLTYYEFGIAAVRIVKDWDVLTLAPDGKTLQVVVAVPRNLPRDQAQTLLNVWTSLRAEAAASNFGTAKTNLIIRTLQAYLNLLTTNSPAKPALSINANPNLSKEQKQ